MVGLVIVSHSRKLAEALVSLIKGTGNGNIPVAATGGIGENNSEFGTDASDIVDAINSVYSDDGVLVLTDLGSSVLSAELALDFLPDEHKSNIKISSAPLVEGAVSAAVQIGLNASLADTVREASGGLIPKQEHLDQDGQETDSGNENNRKEDVNTGGSHYIEQILTVHTVHGLHARPAAKLIQLIATFDADAEISNISKNRGPVSAKSLNRLLSLNVLKNDSIRISAAGKQAKSLVDAVTALVNENFGEITEVQDTATGYTQKEKKQGSLTGISDGIAVGKAFIIATHVEEVKKAFTTDREKEQRIFIDAAVKVEKNILKRKQELASKVSGQETGIFDAHLILLKDPELYDTALQLIGKEGYTAAYAWAERVKAVSRNYELLTDEYLRQRAKDVLDVGSQMAEILAGTTNTGIKVKTEKPVILFADDLTPSQTASFDSRTIAGIVTRYGGPTSHTAILCRALAIPAVCGFTAFDTVTEGKTMVIDGSKGQILSNPTEEELAEAETAAAQRSAEQKKLQESAGTPAVTADGSRIELWANLASPEDAEMAVRYGAEGSGLFRTEFLFLNRTTAPDEEEQYEAFMKVGKAFGQKPVIIRTFDIGGDKQIDYMSLPDEANPFLGVRGIRLYEKNRDIFTVHIRAILRAAVPWNFRIMVPMITEAEECAHIRKEIEKIHIKLELENIKHRWPIPIGAMIETPAAAILTGTLAQEADFFSIGSNDLTQYVMAAERGNQNLSRFSDPMHPAVLSVIRQAVEGAHRYGKQIGLCGEMGSDMAGIAALIGLGIDEISLTSVRIPEAKAFVRTLYRSQLEALVPRLEEKKNAEETRSLIRKIVTAQP